MKTYYFYEKVYRSAVLCIANCTNEEANNYIRKKYNVEAEISTRGGLVFHLENDITLEPLFVLYIVELSYKPIDLAMFAHEVWHLVDKIFMSRGVNRYDNGEAIAYYLQYLYETCLTNLLKPGESQKGKDEIS